MKLLYTLFIVFFVESLFAIPCEYAKSASCGSHQVCIKVSQERAECRSLPIQLPTVSYPFHRDRRVFCDQGVKSSNGNSHSYINTIFALDLKTPKATDPGKIFASLDGTAITVSNCVESNSDCGAGFGNHIKVLRADGLLVMYAHLAKVFIRTGQKIKKGQVIGVEGNTGKTGVDNRHLHFSVHSDWRRNGFDFYRDNLGSLPLSIPFSMNMCQVNHGTCKSTFVDVQKIKCHRDTGRQERVRSF